MKDRLLTFDLDNTLWDVDSVIIAAEQAMRGWLREHVPDVVALYEGSGIADIRTRVITEHPELRHNLSRLRVLIVQRSIEACGYAEAEAAVHAQSAFEVFMEGRHRVQYFDGAKEVLETLASRYRMAALTNGNADIVRLGLDRYFEFALSAAQVGRGKPAPDMFLAALARSGVSPHRAAHIGDHLSDDIAGAQGVGMRTIWANLKLSHRPDDAAIPDATVLHLRDVPRAVDEILA